LTKSIPRRRKAAQVQAPAGGSNSVRVLARTARILRGDRFLLALPFIFLTPLFWRWDVSRASFYLLAMLGMLRLFGHGPLNKEERWLLLTVLLYLAVGLCAYAVNDLSIRPPDHHDKTFLWRYTIFVWAVPIYLAFAQVRLPRHYPVMLFTLGTAMAGLAAVAQLWLPQISGLWGILDEFSNTQRVSANSNPIFFACLTFCMLSVVLALGAPLCRRWYGMLWLIGSIGAGIFAVLSSGTRAAWLAAPVVLVLLLLFSWRQLSPAWARTVLVLVLASPLLAYQWPSVKDRVELAASEVRLYLQSDDPRDHARTTSIGKRLEMWRTAWRLFIRQPLLGTGPNGYKMAGREQARSGRASPWIEQYDDPHNEYLGALAMRGLPGLASVVLLLSVPGLLCWHRVRGPDDENTPLALAGLLVVTSFAIFGLTSNPLEQESEALFYAFTLALILGALRHRERLRDSAKSETAANAPRLTGHTKL